MSIGNLFNSIVMQCKILCLFQFSLRSLKKVEMTDRDINIQFSFMFIPSTECIQLTALTYIWTLCFLSHVKYHLIKSPFNVII